MSPTIPILSALLLALMSGSTEGGQRMDSIALLRQTLRYWRKIYKTYHEEVMLGYCWADYLLEISDELSANLSATSFAATGDHSDANVAATKSQQNPFPQNVMVHATSYEGTRTGKHLRGERSHAATSSTIWEFTNDSDESRGASSSTTIRKRQKWTICITERDVAFNDRTDQVDENDGNESATPMINFYHETRRHLPTKMYHEDENEASRGHEFSSRRTNSRAFNPLMSNPPRNDDRIDSRSMNFPEKEEDTRRKVSPTTNRDFSKAKGVLRSSSFSRKIFPGRERRSFDGRRFPFQRCPQLRERNPKVDAPLSDPCRMPEVDRGMRRDPEGCQVPLSGYKGGIPSRLQFRWWINANTDRRRRTGVVKLTDSEGNSSRDLAGPINSRTSRRKLKELSRNSLLSPRAGGGVAVVERSIPESRRGGRAAIKRNAFPVVETAGASGTRKRCSRSGEEEGSRAGRDVSLVPVVMCIFCKSGLERTEQKTLYGNWWRSFAAISQESEQRDEEFVPSTRSATLLPLEEFMDHGNLTSQSARNSRSNALRDLREDRQSPGQQPSFASTVRSIVIAVLKTLGMFVQVGRQIMDVVESNAALACTKEYLWVKMIKWIDA